MIYTQYNNNNNNDDDDNYDDDSNNNNNQDNNLKIKYNSSINVLLSHSNGIVLNHLGAACIYRSTCIYG